MGDIIVRLLRGLVPPTNQAKLHSWRWSVVVTIWAILLAGAGYVALNNNHVAGYDGEVRHSELTAAIQRLVDNDHANDMAVAKLSRQLADADNKGYIAARASLEAEIRAAVTARCMTRDPDYKMSLVKTIDGLEDQYFDLVLQHTGTGQGYRQPACDEL